MAEYYEMVVLERLGVEVKSSHSLLAEVVVWQHPIHCLCVCVSGERGEKWVAGKEAKEQAWLLLQCLKSLLHKANL